MLKKSHKDDRFVPRSLSPDLEYCFIVDAQNGHTNSDLFLLTFYWKLIKYARNMDLANQKSKITEEQQDNVLHQKISEFLDCVHSYDPDKYPIPFFNYVVNKILKNGKDNKKKIPKKIIKRFAYALTAVPQVEKSMDESSASEESLPILERLSGTLPDQESLLHQKTLSDAFSKRIFTALNSLESNIIRGIYYKDKSDQELARELGKTLTKVRAIERKALRKIRNEIRKQQLYEDLSA